MEAKAGLAADLEGERAAALRRYREVRARTERLAEPLSPEDQAIQSMADVSPTKWHRAHTSWFFENFLLLPFAPQARPYDPAYLYLFNSYYEGAGARHPRPERGLLSRPGAADIASYRAHIDEAMTGLIGTCSAAIWREVAPLIELGLNHEEQHQELILMDIKHVLSMNPLQPAYAELPSPVARAVTPLEFVAFGAGLREIGYGGNAFAFDNEAPRHKAWLDAFRLGSRLTTCREYLSFIEDGGYRRPELWLSDGWATVQRGGWDAPLYWRHEGGAWTIFTLGGTRALALDEPVCHVSFYEADAFARWSGKRLPSEAEWEVAAAETRVPAAGNLMDRGVFHPEPSAHNGGGLVQMIGDVWEWTSSDFTPWPGFTPMIYRMYSEPFFGGDYKVLRGGSWAVAPSAIRPSFRNWDHPIRRQIFTGVRLAWDA